MKKMTWKVEVEVEDGQMYRLNDFTYQARIANGRLILDRLENGYAPKYITADEGGYLYVVPVDLVEQDFSPTDLPDRYSLAWGVWDLEQGLSTGD